MEDWTREGRTFAKRVDVVEVMQRWEEELIRFRVQKTEMRSMMRLEGQGCLQDSFGLGLVLDDMCLPPGNSMSISGARVFVGYVLSILTWRN